MDIKKTTATIVIIAAIALGAGGTALGESLWSGHGDIEATKTDITKLVDAYKHKNGQLIKAKQTLTDAIAAQDNLAVQNDNLNQQLDKVKADLNNSDNSNTQLHEQLKQKETEIQHKIAEIQQKIADGQKAVDDKQAEINKLNDELNTEKQSNADLQQALKDAQDVHSFADNAVTEVSK